MPWRQSRHIPPTTGNTASPYLPRNILPYHGLSNPPPCLRRHTMLLSTTEQQRYGAANQRHHHGVYLLRNSHSPHDLPSPEPCPLHHFILVLTVGRMRNDTVGWCHYHGADLTASALQAATLPTLYPLRDPLTEHVLPDPHTCPSSTPYSFRTLDTDAIALWIDAIATVHIPPRLPYHRQHCRPLSVTLSP